jgi:hypothetical protein
VVSSLSTVGNKDAPLLFQGPSATESQDSGARSTGSPLSPFMAFLAPGLTCSCHLEQMFKSARGASASRLLSPWTLTPQTGFLGLLSLAQCHRIIQKTLNNRNATVLEVRSLRSRCHRGWLVLRTSPGPCPSLPDFCWSSLALLDW